MRVVEGSLRRETSLRGQKIEFLTRDIKEADVLFDRYRDKPLEVIIKPQKRSLDANAYMWVLCDKIAGVLHATKEEVYRNAVKEVGKYDDIAVQGRALGAFISAWKEHGIGWFTDVFDSKLDGCKRVRVYYGSSVYDTKEMARLIDYIVDAAEDLGIETMTPDQLTELVGRWEK